MPRWYQYPRRNRSPPLVRLLKTTASCVLAALKASTYRHRVRFGLSLAAALMNGQFEQPARISRRSHAHSALSQMLMIPHGSRGYQGHVKCFHTGRPRITWPRGANEPMLKDEWARPYKNIKSKRPHTPSEQLRIRFELFLTDDSSQTPTDAQNEPVSHPLHGRCLA